MVTALRGAKEKAIIGLVILDCRGLTFKPPMEKVKAEPRTKAFYESEKDTLLPMTHNVQKQQDVSSLWQIW